MMIPEAVAEWEPLGIIGIRKPRRRWITRAMDDMTTYDV